MAGLIRARDRVSSLKGIAMAAVYYTITGIVLYLLADWILRSAEARAGRIFGHRTLIFFALLLSMALVTFAVIRSLVPPEIAN
ncbi:MAG: hypothetical protein OEW16_04090 [Gammaproteobacteria bacterium]|nr:hypothetical protein [Gammaproteobacteria bacterium]